MQHIRPIEYLEPTSTAEACACLCANGASPLSGGTDVMVMLRRMKSTGVTLVNLKKLPGLRGISPLADGGHSIGAMTSVAKTAAFARTPELSVLGMGCASLGTPGVRNLATLGGNVGRASPASDILPTLLALDATIVLVGPEGERTCQLEGLLSGPGRLALRPGEFVSAILLPPQAGSTGAYFKAGRIRGADCALAGAGVQLRIHNGRIERARVALAAVGPVPLRAPTAEAVLTGKEPTPSLLAEAARAAASDARPISDLRASAEYRKELISALTEKALRHALAARG